MTTKVPTVFISYAWEEDVKAWVLNLATRLRREGGLDVQIDQWHVAPGDPLPAFMERAIRSNDFVLLVCTPKYKAKSDDRQGGVGYEGHIITAEVFTSENHRKFIPILRKGDWKSAAPSFLLGKVYVDFRDDPYSEASYQELLKALHRRLPGPPTIGPTPAFDARSSGPSAVTLPPVVRGGSSGQWIQSSTPGAPSTAASRNGSSGKRRTTIIALVACIFVLVAVLVVLSRLSSLSSSVSGPSTTIGPPAEQPSSVSGTATTTGTPTELLGQPEQTWLELYQAAIDSHDVDRIIARHALPTRRFFMAQNQDAEQLRKHYQGWFDGDGRTKRTGFDKCSLASIADDGSRALRCETYVEPPFKTSRSRVPTCLVFRFDGKLLSRTEISKGSTCPP
jgi:hypothetical protein